jgi:3-dehydroquinate dehydratase-2
MTQPIYVLNGPNLNRLGTREPEIYGTTTLADIEAMCRTAASAQPIEFRQTNSETQLIEWVHEAIDSAAAIVINPAAFSFTSLALLDALKMFRGPIIEVHISNIHRREPLYHRSLVSLAATGVIAGLGASGYTAAIEAVAKILTKG